MPFGASPTSLAGSSLSTYFRVQDRPWWRVALVAPTATPVRAARGWRWGQGGRPGEHALCLYALPRACQTTGATSHAYGARVGSSSLRRRNLLVWPRLATAAGYLPARRSRWRPVRARPLGWRGALWCDPHQPRSLVLIHLLSFVRFDRGGEPSSLPRRLANE